MSDFFDQLPGQGLPEAVPDTVPSQPNALDEIHQVSPCVQESLNHLVAKTKAEDRLRPQDMFVDIARHGRGSSVRKLRANGVDRGRINEIVQQLGWSVVERA